MIEPIPITFLCTFEKVFSKMFLNYFLGKLQSFQEFLPQQIVKRLQVNLFTGARELNEASAQVNPDFSFDCLKRVCI